MTATPLAGFLAIPLSELHASPNNPRDRLQDIEELAMSIAENGLIQPIVVQKIPGHDGFQIVAGHRRAAAARRLGMVKVPCIVRRDMLPDEELLAMLVENGQRANLDPIEEARALHKLKAGGLTDAQIARKVGRSIATVSSRLMLLTLPAHEQDAVRAGHYTLGHATSLVIADRDQQRRLANPIARPVGRPKGAKTRPYFGDQHPLARSARAVCSCIGRPKISGIACGPCWELVIRADASSQETS